MAKTRFHEEPPPPSRVRTVGVWEELLSDLVEHPGKWALVHTSDTNAKAGATVSNLKRRRVRIPDPDGLWEFTQRGSEVWARFRPRKRRTSTRRR